MLRLVLSVIAAFSTVFAAHAQSSGGRLDGIAKSHTIKLAHRTDATPFSFVNERKDVDGYSVDICKLVVAAVERQLNAGALKIEWVPVTSQTRFETVASGKADLECGSSTVTLGRMKDV